MSNIKYKISNNSPREACGVFGVFNNQRASELTYYGLFALQHRGQESAGITVKKNGRLSGHTGMGLANEVFTPEILSKLEGNAAIGHVRYSTTGSSDVKNAQPLLVDYAHGQLSVAHNGNLVNAKTLRDELEASGSIFQTTTDSEIIIHLMARPSNGSFENILKSTARRIQGAYSIVMLTPDSLIGMRDSCGLRPLSIGKIKNSYVLASETCAFDLVGAKFVRDVEPGEIVVINDEGISSIKFSNSEKNAMCIFEYVYFARPDSILKGKTCHIVRKEFGKQLAKEFPVKADIITSIPDSGNSAAIGFSEESGIPYEMGFIRNHYVGRTFISPNQGDRDIKVKVKLNVIPEVVKGKSVVIVDDSIIRGTTTLSRIVELKKAGAKEVHVRISCPPTRHPCFYGVDFPSTDNLIAAQHTVEEISEFLDADSLGYLNIESMREICGGGDNFCLACYDGNYPVAIDGNFEKNIMEKGNEKNCFQPYTNASEFKKEDKPQKAKSANKKAPSKKSTKKNVKVIVEKKSVEKDRKAPDLFQF